MADNDFNKNDCDKDKVRILSAFFVSKDSTGAGYFIFGTKKAFNFFFTPAFILHYFELERYIRIEIKASSNIIGGILSWLTLNDLKR